MKVNCQKYRIFSFTPSKIRGSNYGVICLLLILLLSSCSPAGLFSGSSNSDAISQKTYKDTPEEHHAVSGKDTSSLQDGHSNLKQGQSQFMSTEQVKRLNLLFSNLNFNKTGWGSANVSELVPVELEGQALVIVNFGAAPSVICNLKSKCAALGSSTDNLGNFRWHKKGLLSFSLKQNYLVVFDLKNNQLLNASRRLPDKISTISFTENGEAIFAGTVSGRIYNWYYFPTENSTFGQLTRYAGHPGLVSKVVTHPTNRIFFSLDWLGQFSAWQTFEAREYQYEIRDNPFDPVFWSDVAVNEKRQFKTEIEEIYLNPAGKYLLILAKSKELLLWKVRGFDEVCKFKIEAVNSIAVSDDWNKLIIDSGNDALIYNLQTVNSEDYKSDSGYCRVEPIKVKDKAVSFKKHFFLDNSLYTIGQGDFQGNFIKLSF